MIVTWPTAGLQTRARVRAFVEGSVPISFTWTDRQTSPQWMVQTLKQLHHGRYLAKVTGLSRAQVTRAIPNMPEPAPSKTAARRRRSLLRGALHGGGYSAAGEVDVLHGTLSGLATCKLCDSMYLAFGDTQYARLAVMANGHRYHLIGTRPAVPRAVASPRPARSVSRSASDASLTLRASPGYRRDRHDRTIP